MRTAFRISDKSLALQARLRAFMEAHIYPNESLWHQQIDLPADAPWVAPPMLATLTDQAREQGLWNLFLPDAEHGAGLTNLDYAPLAEIMGRVTWAPEVFNCSAPDTGNMELIAQYGSEEQKRRWLPGLLDGSMRSCYLMTEPGVASSDATNVALSIRRDGDSYVLNGRKWFITGAMNPVAKLWIVMGKSDPNAAPH
jgi:acyl-CoA dehydrogenase